MKVNPTPKAQHKHLLELFTQGYTSMCKHMPPCTQKGLTDAAPLVFSKWFYTSLATDTILTPANIIGMDLKKDGDETEYAYVLEATAEEGYDFSLLSYSLTHHPFVEDMRTMIDFCLPDRQVDDHLFFTKEDQAVLLAKLSIQSDFYLEYLTRLGWWLGLFVYMPAIHVKKIQPSPICEVFFSRSVREILLDTVDAACELATERFTFSMDLEPDVASPHFFHTWLLQPEETDSIFIEFYKRVDVDIEEIWKVAPADLDEDDKAIISSFLFTGIMLDKWFLFPMAAFLHLIRPINFIPIRYYQMVNNLAALLTMEHNIGTEIFTPPAYYTMTSLGEELMLLDKMPKLKYEMPDTLTYEQIMDALEREAHLHTLEETFHRKSVKDIFSIRVFRQADEDLWKVIEVSQEASADEFCKDLCTAFGMDEVEDYVLSIPDENDFPVDYSPEGSKRSINKTTGKSLGNLISKQEQVLTLIPMADRNWTLVLTILEATAGNPHILYPRVCAQSEKIKALERIDELF